MTTERIDVLAVMYEAARIHSRICTLFPEVDASGEMARGIDEARAAVAELIEAAKDEQAQACGNFKAKSCGHDGYCICPGDRLRAALARIGGAP